MFVGFFMILAVKPINATTDPEKPRVIVLTDIENEPDDAQSLVRFLTYANHFEVEGIIATTSVWLRNKTAEWRIHEILEAYKEVQPNLEKHEEGYPAYEDLKEKIKVGIPLYGMKGVGEGKDSGDSGPWMMNSPTIGPITGRWGIQSIGWSWRMPNPTRPVSKPLSWVIPRPCISSCQ